MAQSTPEVLSVRVYAAADYTLAAVHYQAESGVLLWVHIDDENRDVASAALSFYAWADEYGEGVSIFNLEKANGAVGGGPYTGFIDGGAADGIEAEEVSRAGLETWLLAALASVGGDRGVNLVTATVSQVQLSPTGVGYLARVADGVEVAVPDLYPVRTYTVNYETLEWAETRPEVSVEGQADARISGTVLEGLDDAAALWGISRTLMLGGMVAFGVIAAGVVMGKTGKPGVPSMALMFGGMGLMWGVTEGGMDATILFIVAFLTPAIVVGWQWWGKRATG